MDGSELSAASSDRSRGRVKTFSGCWTCRARHLKCDENRPVCNRCQRAGRRCEGYGVRLSWTSIRGPANFSAQTTRKSRQSPIFKSYLSRLPHQGAVSSGAAPEVLEQHKQSAHRTESPTWSTHPNASPTLTEEPRHSEPGTLFEDFPTPGLENEVEDPSETCSRPQLQQSQDQRATPSPRVHAKDTSSVALDEFQIFTPTSSKDPGLGFSDVPGSTHRFTVPSTANTSNSPNDVATTSKASISKSRHLDNVPNPGLRGQLVEHWVVFLCDALNPIPGIHNPLRTIFMPIALEGARADLKTCTGATALFHLICAASAFHLLQIQSKLASKHDLENAALEHYNLGITHIGQNIQVDDRSQCVALLASFITCILNEAVMVPTPFWRLHIKGAVEWVKHINPQIWHQTEAASTVYQMFMGMATLIQSQLLLGDDRTEIWELLFDPASRPGPYILDQVLGLPQSLLEGITAINIFRRQNKSPNLESSVQDLEQFTESVDRLELEVYLSAPSRISASHTTEHGDLTYHHAYAYYFATLIYIKRVVKDVPLEDIQDLVDQSLSHLESLGTSAYRTFSPLMWPVAIIAFDTCRETSQQRILKCIETFVEKSRLTVWTNLANLAQDVWALRKIEGNANLKWHKSFLLFENDSLMML